MSGLISRSLIYDGDPNVWKMDIEERVARWLPHIKVGGADLLIGVWEAPKEAKLAGSSLFAPDKTKAESGYQGVTGLVLKMGPYAFNTEKTTHWFIDEDGNADPVRVGEWVQFNFKQGEAFLLDQQRCRYVNDQYILGRLPRPDIVS